MANPDVVRITAAEEHEIRKAAQRLRDQEDVYGRLLELGGCVETGGRKEFLELLAIEGLSTTRLDSVIWHLQQRPAKIQFFSRFESEGTTKVKEGLKIVVL